MVSLGELTRAAGASLRPLAPFDAARPITGVHASELDDPGRYLEGGELLLTTGIPLRSGSIEAYVDRLDAHGIGAIGIGLGEGWDDAPPALVERCRLVGIPVFAVPDGAPFLDVSRAFWSNTGRTGDDEVLRTAHAHTRLVQAATGAHPVTAIVRQMAQAIGGWVAWLPFGAGAPAGMLHPPSLEGLLPAVRVEVERTLVRSGVEAASFVSHGSTVMAHAVTDGERIRGALALGAGRPLARADRQLALTATALLRLVAVQSTGRRNPEAWITALALQGDAAAARALAAAADIELPLLFRVLVGADDASDFGIEQRGVRVALVPADAEVTRGSGALSSPAILDDLPAAAARALALHRNTPHTSLLVEPESRAEGWVDLLAEADPMLQRTVVAYLRHRQQAERTARELGVHRNTVRPRIAAAERLLAVRLDDPDVAAELWLALRDRTI
ncbi:PucR family transcriptional regulator ligand-binding domain-containing protein [Microbacterium sp. NPDC087665]|uniref:PucR family transcriptional regulator n=1 Tax=Microbacterium sp. NPDC087665 TaxID=3364194 RepID=UPI00381CFBEC